MMKMVWIVQWEYPHDWGQGDQAEWSSLAKAVKFADSLRTEAGPGQKGYRAVKVYEAIELTEFSS